MPAGDFPSARRAHSRRARLRERRRAGAAGLPRVGAPVGEEHGWADDPAEDPGYPAWEAWLPETVADEDPAGSDAPWYAPSGSRGGIVWPGAPIGFGADAGPGPVYAGMEDDAPASAGYAAASEDLSRRSAGDGEAGAPRPHDAGAADLEGGTPWPEEDGTAAAAWPDARDPWGDGGEDPWPETVAGPAWTAGDPTAVPYDPGTADVAFQGTWPGPGDTAGAAGWPADPWGESQPPPAAADWEDWGDAAPAGDLAAPAPDPIGGGREHRHIDVPVARLRPHPSAPARPHPVAAAGDRASLPVPPRAPLPPLPPLTPPPSSAPPDPDGGWAPQRGGGTLTLAPDEAPPRRADDKPPGAPAPRSSTRNAVEWVVIIAAALIAALVIKTYLLQAFYIPSPSMEPTLKIQDRVLVNKLSYRLHDVHRGDVVVFERPPNDVGTIRDLIKRVIGLPGDTVEGKDGGVWINGERLNEPYLPRGTVTSTFAPKAIPPGYIWVMGDNRSNSSDSRVFGVVDEDRIVGRAFVRVWPLSAIGLL